MKWISVNEYPPQNNQRVKIRTFNKEGKEIEINAIFHLYDIDENMEAWGWDIGNRTDTIARPTHWMPLPQEPNE